MKLHSSFVTKVQRKPKKKKSDVEENLKHGNPKSFLHILHLQQNVKNTLRLPSTHEMEVTCKEAIHNMKVQTIQNGDKDIAFEEVPF